MTLNGGQTWTNYVRNFPEGNYPKWYPVSNTYNQTGFNNSFLWSGKQFSAALTFDKFSTNRLWHTNGWGVLYTDDSDKATTNWKLEMKNLEELVVTTTRKIPDGPLITGVWDKGAFVHNDVNIVPDKYVAFTPWLSNFNSVDFSNKANNNVVMVGSNQMDVSGDANNITGQIAFSNDKGKTWAELNKPTGNPWAGQIAISSSNPQNMVWGARLDLPWDYKMGMFYTKDKGQTWSVSNGIPADQFINPLGYLSSKSLVADSQNPNRFYMFDCSSGTSWNRVFYRSDDGGANFSKVYNTWENSKLPCEYDMRLKTRPDVENELWLTCMGCDYNYTIRRSRDGGNTIENLDLGFSNVKEIAFGKNSPDKNYPSLFVLGTRNNELGLYRSDDSLSPTNGSVLAGNWVKISGNRNLETALSIEGDMQKYTQVYVGTSGRGIMQANKANINVNILPASNPQFPTRPLYNRFTMLKNDESPLDENNINYLGKISLSQDVLIEMSGLKDANINQDFLTGKCKIEVFDFRDQNNPVIMSQAFGVDQSFVIGTVQNGKCIWTGKFNYLEPSYNLRYRLKITFE
jgi:hypothetical protein